MQGIQKTKQLLTNLFKARFPILYVQTWEERRVIELVDEIVSNQELIKTTRKIYLWSLCGGLVDLKTGNNVNEDSNSVGSALSYFMKLNENAVLIMSDMHIYFETEKLPDNAVIRKLRETAEVLAKEENMKNIVLTSPVLKIPVELEKDITIVDFELPNIDEIRECLDKFIDDNKDVIGINLSDEDRALFAKTAQGLTLHEAENAFARAMVERKGLSIKELDIIVEEKCQVIKKTGILEFVKSNVSIDDVGGLDNLKKWLIKRNRAWSDKAKKLYNLPFPKGVLITGLPGGGKSLTAKAMSSLWNLPLLKFDVGKIFNKWLGSSEENLRKAIYTAEAVAPSILWLDEIEKGLSSTESLDGGTSRRVFGTFLTWLQEKTKPVFVVATANNISMLPPEMLRKGRFDEIFFVDLPTDSERKSIFKLHLNKMLRNSISEEFDVSDELLKQLVDKTNGFVGSEIEQVVISAIFEAFSEDRILRKEDLFHAIESTVPLSETQKEQIEKIREWAKKRAVPATINDVIDL